MPNLKNKVVTYMTLSADASTCNNPSQVYAKKSDANSRYLVVRIVDANGNIDVKGNAQLNATKPDGTHVYVGGDTNDDGTVTILLKSSVLALDGKVSCDITVFDKEDTETVVLTTSTFFILVADSNYKADALESTNEFSMSAEMIAQVAEDRRVAEQAREEAEKSLTNIENIMPQGAFANALKGSLIGEAVRIDDVSPIGHEMAVRVSGKNLFNNDTSKIEQVTYIGQTTTGQRFGYALRLPSGTYIAHAKYKDDNDAKDVYIYGVLNTAGGAYKQGVSPIQAETLREIVFTVDEGDILYIYDGHGGHTLGSAQAVFARVNVQVERGTTATDYEPYVELGPVKVKKYGKNLLSYPFSNKSKTANGITWTDNGDGTVRANGTAEATVSFSFASTTEMNWLGGKVISISGCPSGGNASSAHYIRMQFLRAGSGIVLTVDDIGKGKTNVKVPDGITSISFFAAIRAGASVQNLVFKPQIELGEAITDYAPYISQVEYIPNEDGTVDGVTAFYPTTTLVTSTAGIIFDTNYNRDANKIIADILSRLSALETAAIN